MDMDDQTLLKRYSDADDQDAFAELVQRHVALVYSVALRQTGDPAQAEDVVQLVFSKLAKRAKSLPENVVLAGWLHSDARFIALQLSRSERRRQMREKSAAEMSELTSQSEPEWQRIRPVLDEGLESLGTTDRDALLLRFFEQKALREVGTALGIGEDAARMRVTRAVDRLRDFLIGRGITTTSAALSIVLAAHGSQTVPSLLAATVISATLSGTISSTTTLGILAMSKLKTGIACAALAAAVATPILWQQSTNHALRDKNNELQSRLLTLERDVEQLHNQNRQLATASRPQATVSSTPQVKAATVAPGAAVAGDQPKAVSSPVTDAEVAAFLQRPKLEQGEFLGNFRRQLRRLGIEQPENFPHDHALATQLRPKLEELESRPQEFADFQTAFIKNSIGVQDETTLTKLHEIIQQSYEQAVAEKLDALSRPQDKAGAEAWGLRRDALDRTATHAVQELLTPEDRQKFDGNFLGIMGIDLGINDGGWHRFGYPDGTTVFPSESASTTKP